MRRTCFTPLFFAFALAAGSAFAAEPATQPAKLPHIQVDLKSKQVRVECEACSENMDVGLEFFCVATGTNEYESVLRTKAKASHLHTALLMVGLKEGEPVKYSEAAKKWIPPHGAPVIITCEWQDADGKTVRVPANRLMQSIKDKKDAPPITWVFTGSKVMEDGKYAADAVGYLVSVLNNELTVIDVGDIASRDLASREWERNAKLLPPPAPGAKRQTIWMILEPAGNEKNNPANPAAKPPATTTPPPKTDAGEDVGTTVVSVDAEGKVKVDGMTVTVERLGEALGRRRVLSKIAMNISPQAPSEVVRRVNDAVREATGNSSSSAPLTDVRTDEAHMKALKDHWAQAVAPHNQSLREAAQAHFEVIEGMRKEQQRLLDEADRIQRVIDDLQKQYQDMTTPRPAESGADPVPQKTNANAAR